MWDETNKNQLTFVLAALILNEKSVKITEEALRKIINSAGIEVEEYWFCIFERVFSEINIVEFLGSNSQVTKKPLETVSLPEKEEKELNKEKSESNSGEDMGFGLFD
mmetsp:Transcript_43611/g.68283  ORF Transcript_43611/g.68283 Transcript_43611/m.68283 type:complete len:107 (+) Transcript_43611:1292-1612(+)